MKLGSQKGVKGGDILEEVWGPPSQPFGPNPAATSTDKFYGNPVTPIHLYPVLPSHYSSRAEAIWSAKLKISTIWAFIGNVF